MGGVALAETLRERLPALPVVLASGYSHVLARRDDHGFELLHKPYSAEQLARILQRVVAKLQLLMCVSKLDDRPLCSAPPGIRCRPPGGPRCLRHPRYSPERTFDGIVLLARQICAAPAALISFVAEDHQWFKARSGFGPGQTPLSQSVCAHALQQADLLVIPDLTADRARATMAL